MIPPASAPSAARRRLVAVVVAAVALFTAPPVAAQYGGGVDLFVDPTRVDIDGSFAYFGTNCPAGSTVTITVDGLPGVLDTTIALGDGSYSGAAVAMPDGVVAGQDYTVRGSCGGASDTAVIRAVCNGGTDPVAGACPDGQTVGGQDLTATTTTTPGSGAGGTDGSGGSTGAGGGAGDRGADADLAVTGASFAEQIAQIGITLVALGALVVLAAGRRRGRALA